MGGVLKIHNYLTAVSVGLSSLAALPAQAGGALTPDGRPIQHVLLISVDGLHALDLANYVNSHPSSTLAALSGHGTTYTNNQTSSPSDSFPGLAALLTGGSPVTTGFWYDVTWNRELSPPAQTDGLGNPGGACPGQIGTIMAMDESIDTDLTRLDGGGGINPAYLRRDPRKGCATVLPHQYLRVNTIFEVARAAGLRTAWTDKHPSYEWTNGPSGHGVDDFYGPEINSIPVALPFAGCTPVPFPDPAPDDGWTTALANVRCYDLLHVKAVLNQIDGYKHDRSSWVGVPAIFGTNFQAVSVGQKLNKDPVTGQPGGYADVLGTPASGLADQLDFIDRSLGRIVQELQAQNLTRSTLIIICAKHGQSPIDRTKNHNIGNGQPSTLLGASESFDISDDGSLIWLADSSQTVSVVSLLSQPLNQQLLGIQEIFAGQSLIDKFNSPLHDPRTPDIILKVNTGVIFTGGTKIAEHGGFNEDDVHTALLVSMDGMPPAIVKTATSNQQVAPTILQALRLDPHSLQAVRDEQIGVLPFLFADAD
jgi:hypothetical protein